MQPPTEQRAAAGSRALMTALMLGLSAARADAGTLAAPSAASDTGRILLETNVAAPPSASAFDFRRFAEGAFAGIESARFDEAPRAPLAAAALPLRGLVLEDSREVARRRAANAGTLQTTLSLGSQVLDALFLLAVPFLLPVILLPRQRRVVSRTWADRAENAGRDRERASESAFDAIVRNPYETSSLSVEASPM